MTRRKYQKWTPTEVRRALAMRRDGMPFKLIARALGKGRTYTEVQCRLRYERAGPDELEKRRTWSRVWKSLRRASESLSPSP